MLDPVGLVLFLLAVVGGLVLGDDLVEAARAQDHKQRGAVLDLAVDKVGILGRVVLVDVHVDGDAGFVSSDEGSEDGGYSFAFGGAGDPDFGFAVEVVGVAAVGPGLVVGDARGKG